MSFTPGSELIEARAALRRDVDRVLERLRDGVLPTAAEREHVDLKEEAARRGAGGLLLPGSPHNLAAADQLAGEVACMANSPGGGALVVGVEDATGALLGSAMEVDWLRHRIYERVDVAPLVEERVVDGIRLLTIYVAAAREPVEDRDNKIRWRTGGACVPVDRAEWWLHRQDSTGADMMAVATDRRFKDITAGAMVVVRKYLSETDQTGAPGTGRGDAEILRYLGVLRPDGRLSQAGATILCPSPRTAVAVSVLDVEGGDVLAAAPDLSGLSVIEQIAAVEARLDALNTSVTLSGSFAETPVRRLPPRAVREAVLNGIVHRDWMQTEPVTVTWVDADSALQVSSPGGFVGGIDATNVLTQRYARYPALADLFRSLRLVDKYGLGVDRMVREMIALGHRPPHLTEDAGPSVRVKLRGGRPVIPVMDLLLRMRPAVRRSDVRVALIVYRLLRVPTVTPSQLTGLLQRPEGECVEALEAAAECVIGDEPLVVPYKDVWRLSASALAAVEGTGAPRRQLLRAAGVLPYRRPADASTVVKHWLEGHDQITSGDHAVLTGLNRAGALKQLERLVEGGWLARGAELGRNAHFTAGPALHGAARVT